MLAPDEVTPRLSKAFRYSKATDLRCSSVIVCFVRAISLERNAALVFRYPLVERLQLRIQFPSNRGAASAQDFFFEVSVDLKHVSHFIGARESKAAVRVGF